MGGLLSKIVKDLAIKKVKKQITKIQGDIPDEEPIKAKVKELGAKYEELDRELSWYCKVYPNSPLCTDAARSKAKWK